ncbi:MAG: hypothetical protein ABII26_02710 [Pseudomonadota bacterium]
MGDIIRLQEKAGSSPDNLITHEPFEFRRADWENSLFLQMLKSQSEKLERHRQEIYNIGKKGVWQLPPHFILRGGMAYTIQGIYIRREIEDQMREVTYLAGLVDCMINQVNPLLRTALIRDMYKKILELKRGLNMNWFGQIDQVLLPIDPQFYNPQEYRRGLSEAKTMKELYRLIREGADEMFDILSLEYTFYTPGRGA